MSLENRSSTYRFEAIIVLNAYFSDLPKNDCIFLHGSGYRHAVCITYHGASAAFIFKV